MQKCSSRGNSLQQGSTNEIVAAADFDDQGNMGQSTPESKGTHEGLGEELPYREHAYHQG